MYLGFQLHLPVLCQGLRGSEILGFQFCYLCMVLPIPIIILFEIIFYYFGFLSEIKIIWRIIFGIILYIFLYGIFYIYISVMRVLKKSPVWLYHSGAVS